MIEFISQQPLSLLGWSGFMLCALFIGMAKTGVAGVYTIIIPIMAFLFGGKESTGVLLPMLIIGDIFAVIYYHRAAAWKYIFRLLPWSVGGIVIGTLVGDAISDGAFKALMGILIILGILIMLYMEWRKVKTVPDYWWFAGILGLLGGFTTMVGNAAGPILAVYLLAMRLPKNAYIGTAAWFFMLINLVKLPFHVFVWETISWSSLWLDLLMIPVIGFGAWAGVKLVKLMPEGFYRGFIIFATVLSAILLIF